MSGGKGKREGGRKGGREGERERERILKQAPCSAQNPMWGSIPRP